jgi:hypothetical protein
MENVSSEQQLKQLLDEGKINEVEYKELLDVIKKPACKIDSSGKIENVNSKLRLGKIAVILTLVGFVLPFICFFIIKATAPPNTESIIHVSIFFAFELTALLLGIKSWQAENGKAAAIASGILIILSILFF